MRRADSKRLDFEPGRTPGIRLPGASEIHRHASRHLLTHLFRIEINEFAMVYQ